MQFNLLSIDWFWQEKLFGFSIFNIQEDNYEFHRSLFEIYWNDREVFIDILWIHIINGWWCFWLVR